MTGAVWLSLFVLACGAAPPAAPPPGPKLVEIPGTGGWRVEPPEGFKQGSGSDCDGSEKLCFSKGRGQVSLSPTSDEGAQCGLSRRPEVTIKEGNIQNHPACTADFWNGNKLFRVNIGKDKWLEVNFRFKVSANDTDNRAADAAFETMKETVFPPPEPPKPPPKTVSNVPKKVEGPLPGQPVPIPDLSGWHFTPPEGFDILEPSASRFGRFSRTDGRYTAWIDLSFETRLDSLCAHGGERVGERFESLRFDKHCFRTACRDDFETGKTARSAEFLIELEDERYVRVRLHFKDADYHSVDELYLPDKLREEGEKGYDRTWRSIAPKGVHVRLDE